MLDIFLERFRQGARTVGYPKTAPAMPQRFRGRPFIDAGRCAHAAGCAVCGQVCPSGAIAFEEGMPVLDMGRCVFCGVCARACKAEALRFTGDWRLASTDRQALLIRPQKTEPAVTGASHDPAGLSPLPVKPGLPPGKGFSRSFRLRQVSAAGCGACEADLNVLSTVVFDLSRFGIDYVASPRHADALVVTGPVPRNMLEALRKCDMATPAPKAVIAVGACAISGGLFRSAGGRSSGQNAGGLEDIMPVDLYIPGCPPHPYTSLDGILRFLGRL